MQKKLEDKKGVIMGGTPKKDVHKEFENTK
jgi:hypothetical protein